MKKIFSIVIIFVMVILCVSCSGDTPEEKRAVEIAKQAIKDIDSYLDFEIDAKELEDNLDSLKSRMPEVPENAHTIDKLSQIDIGLFNCESRASTISWNVTKGFDDISDAEQGLIDSRNSLAKVIGVKKR